MSRMSDEFAAALPEGWSIPDELERAFTWIEAQPWKHDGDNGHFLTPYDPVTDLWAIVFCADLGARYPYLAPTWEPAAQEHFNARVVPIADAERWTAAMWREYDGSVRFVAIGHDGYWVQLAENAVDFLRLISIGYVDLTRELDEAPMEDYNLVEETAAFRQWVRTEFSVEVPAVWDSCPDRFGYWCEALERGEFPP